MINKLLLVREAYAKANLLDQHGLGGMSKDKPLQIRPASKAAGWDEESGITHYGYVFKDLKREEWVKLQKFDQDTEGTTILNLADSVEATLAGVGLVVCS